MIYTGRDTCFIASVPPVSFLSFLFAKRYQARSVEREHDGGDQYKLYYDTRYRVEQRSGDKRLKREGPAVDPEQDHLRRAPYDTARYHRGNYTEVKRADVLPLYRRINESADEGVSHQLKRHGYRAGIHGRHVENKRTEKRKNERHRRRVLPSADQSAEKYRYMHR